MGDHGWNPSGRRGSQLVCASSTLQRRIINASPWAANWVPPVWRLTLMTFRVQSHTGATSMVFLVFKASSFSTEQLWVLWCFCTKMAVGISDDDDSNDNLSYLLAYKLYEDRVNVCIISQSSPYVRLGSNPYVLNKCTDSMRQFIKQAQCFNLESMFGTWFCPCQWTSFWVRLSTILDSTVKQNIRNLL